MEPQHEINSHRQGPSDHTQAHSRPLGLKPGDKVKFFIQPDGRVVILPTVPITALKGFLKSRVGPVSIEDMETAIAEGAAGLPLSPKRK